MRKASAHPCAGLSSSAAKQGKQELVGGGPGKLWSAYTESFTDQPVRGKLEETEKKRRYRRKHL